MQVEAVVSQQSSLTEGSAQLAPTRPTAVRRQDKGKFVGRRDVQVKTAKELDEALNKVQQAIDGVIAKINAIEQAIKWRSALPESYEGYRLQLTECKKTLTRQENRLHGTRGIDKHIAVVKDTSAIPGIIQRVQSLELELYFANKKHEQFEALSNAGHFHKLYASVQARAPNLFAPTLEAVAVFSITSFLDSIDEIVKEYVALIDASLLPLLSRGNDQDVKEFIKLIKESELAPEESRLERSKLLATKMVYLELLRICHKVADSKQVFDVQRITWRLNVLAVLIEQLEQDLGVRKPVIKREEVRRDFGHWGPGVLIEVDRSLQVSEKELSDLSRGPDSDNGFWKHVGRKDRWWYSAGYYAATGALGNTFERTVGLPLHGLNRTLKEKIVAVCQGKEVLKREALEQFEGCIIALEKCYDTHFKTLCTTQFDRLSVALIDYAYGLAWGFQEARGLLKVLLKCSKESVLQVFSAISDINKQYKMAENSTELEQVLALYDVVAHMKELEDKLPEKTQKPFSQFLWRTVQYLNEVHATKNPQLLQLSEEQASVPRQLFAKQNFDPGAPLPEEVLLFLAKRVLQYLFLPSDTHDMELELVLYVLKEEHDGAYYKSLDVHAYIRPLLGAYERGYEKFRLDKAEHLEPARQIARLAATNSVQSYAMAWQRLFEFTRNLVEEPAQLLGSYLRDLLDETDFESITDELVIADIETWQVADADQLLEQLKKKNCTVSQLLLRLVAPALYAADLKEELVAQERLAILFQNNGLSQHIAACPQEIKDLLAENVMKKVVTAAALPELTSKEVALLVEGPFKPLLDGRTVSLETASAQMALYRLKNYHGVKEHLPPNFDMAFETLLRHNPIPQNQISLL